MGDVVTLRPARAEEADAVAALVKTAFEHRYMDLLGRAWEPGEIEAVRDAVRRGRVTLAEIGGAPVGALWLEEDGETLWIDHVAVAAQAQGRGVGRVLLDQAERVARDGGFRLLKLLTAEMMDHLIALYAARGFVETHREPPKNGADTSLRVYMEKRL